MSPGLTITIDIQGLAESLADVQRLRGALNDRRGLHAHLAAFGENKLQKYVASIKSHKTANRLGAKPTEHLAHTALGISSESDENQLRILIPRKTRLRAAFGALPLCHS